MPEIDLVMGPQYANRLSDLLEGVFNGSQIALTLTLTLALALTLTLTLTLILTTTRARVSP